MTEWNSPKLRFIGHLSDQEPVSMNQVYDLVAILSGPEPQRTKLEKEILPQLIRYPGKCALVRGVITDDVPKQEGSVIIFPYMDRSGVNQMLNSAEIILCRTGYSSLMDLLKVGTKAILIPTPGQPEQIYLGERLKEHSQFVVQGQGEVDVVEGVKKLRTSRSPVQKHSADGLLAKAIRALQLRLG
jgi:hypothetical protein